MTKQELRAQIDANIAQGKKNYPEAWETAAKLHRLYPNVTDEFLAAINAKS